MKKILPIFLVVLTLLSGCKIKSYTPELPTSFSQAAVVSSGDFSFECEICTDLSNTQVKVLSTEAQGLCYSYDGSSLSFGYGDFSHSVDEISSFQSNTAVIIYDLCQQLSLQNEQGVSRIDDGFKYEGKTDFGNYILIQNENGTLRSLSFRNSDYIIEFK